MLEAIVSDKYTLGFIFFLFDMTIITFLFLSMYHDLEEVKATYGFYPLEIILKKFFKMLVIFIVLATIYDIFAKMGIDIKGAVSYYIQNS